MKRVFAFIAVLILLLEGFAWWLLHNSVPSTVQQLSLAQAIAIAQQPASACVQKGVVGTTGTYNPNSKTWWIDFTPSTQYVRNGCNPACVVSSTSSVEINWRCTGVIPPAAYDDLIEVVQPLPNSRITSPIQINGRARGTWYFEASFPITLLDGNGAVLGHTQGKAQGEWTTNEYVPFIATLFYPQPTTATGTLILKNDNPSGNPSLDKFVRIPVTFGSSS